MAAPTDVRVESKGIDSAILYWTYPGVADISVYRALDGVTYTLVIATVDALELNYIDTGLTPGTKYWYKVSDDVGATYSAVVTVVVQRCVDANGSMSGFNLARFVDGEPAADELNNLAQRVEEIGNAKVLIPEPCLVCIDDGAVTFDCTGGCTNFRVIMTEDINSISIQNCGQCPEAEFIVAPHTIRKVCGWPSNCHHFGDECFHGEVDGEEYGKTLFTNGSTVDGYGNSDPTPPGACPCLPTTVMHVKCCSPNCDINCTTNPSIKLKVCNGLEPYTWSKTGPVTLSATKGVQITVRATTTGVNNFPGEIAYTDIYAHFARLGTEGCFNGPPNTWLQAQTWVCYGCDGASLGPCVPAGEAIYYLRRQGCTPGDFATSSSHIFTETFGDTLAECWVTYEHPANGVTLKTTPHFEFRIGAFDEEIDCEEEFHLMQAMVNIKTTAMQAGGCSQCTDPGGATVTCTDSVGVSVTYVL